MRRLGVTLGVLAVVLGGCLNLETTDPSKDGVCDCTKPEDADCGALSQACGGETLWAKAGIGSSNDRVNAMGAVSDRIVLGLSTDVSEEGNEGDTRIVTLLPDGTLQWAKVIGALSGRVSTTAVAIDAQGNILAGGTFDGEMAIDGTILSSIGDPDLFLLKLGPDGKLLWTKTFDAPGYQGVAGVAVDAEGNIFVAGNFIQSFNLGGTDLVAPDTEFDAYVARFDANGNHAWSQRFGGVGQDHARRIAVTADGDVVVLGEFQTDIVFGGVGFVSAGYFDVFLARLSGSDGAPVWQYRFGGPDSQTASGLAIGSDGEIAIGGEFENWIGIGDRTFTSNGGMDAFVAKLSADGSAVAWAKSFGDAATQGVADLALDPAGNVIAIGTFNGSVSLGSSAMVSAGYYDVFVTKMSSKDGTYLWSHVYGLEDEDRGTAIVADPAGGAFIGGEFRATAGTTFDMGAPESLVGSGGSDFFVAHLSP